MSETIPQRRNRRSCQYFIGSVALLPAAERKHMFTARAKDDTDAKHFDPQIRDGKVGQRRNPVLPFDTNYRFPRGDLGGEGMVDVAQMPSLYEALVVKESMSRALCACSVEK